MTNLARLKENFDTKIESLTNDRQKIGFCLDTRELVRKLYRDSEKESTDASAFYNYVVERQNLVTLKEYGDKWDIAI